MKNRVSIALLAVFCLAPFASTTQAQEQHHSQITIAHRGAKALRDDLTFLFSLTSPREQQQREKYFEFIDLFLYGVDEKKPLRIDVLMGTTPPTYVVWGYWTQLPDLLDNITSNFALKKRSPELYELLEPKGWLRVINSERYGIFLQTEKDRSEFLKQYIQKLSGFRGPVDLLLTEGVNVGVGLKNPATTEADQEKRRKSFAEIRATRLDAIKKRPAESDTEFALRKKFVVDEVEEIERVLVEAADVKALVSLDKTTQTAQISISAKAIPETSLAKSIQLFNKTPDRFASVPQREDGVMSARINHPIDEMRQQNYLEFTELMKQDIYARAGKDDSLNADQKAATRELIDGILAVVNDGISSGNINGFLETSAKGLDFSSVVAVTAVESNRLNDILPLITKASSGNEFEADVAKVKEVRIHRVKLMKGYFDIFDQLFGIEQVVHIGVGEDVVWFGVGGDSLQPLSEAIESLGEPAENSRVLTINANLKPWVSRTIDLVKKMPAPTELRDRKTRQDRLRNLTISEESMEQGGGMTVAITVQDGTVKGELNFEVGTLKFVGRMLALIGKNNL